MSRYLELSPKQLANLTREQFLDSIRASECRVVSALICPCSANYVERVSNLELVASFGADFITLEGYNPRALQMPGLPSKNPESDFAYRDNLQVDMGYGWTVRELKELVGRPIGACALIPATEDEDFGLLYNKNRYSPEMMESVVEDGYDYIFLGSANSDKYTMEKVMDTISEAKKIAGNKIAIESGVPHGPGTAAAPYNLREIITPDVVRGLAKAGADLIDVPAVGIVPGFTKEYVSSLSRAAHDEKALVVSSIAHSLEGADPYTVKRLVLDSKICGADVICVAAGGVYESVPLPETLLDICIAAKGRRHTYRRMCQSPLR